jgi:predicted NBD/HSP70 family sugar kinase
MVPSRPLRPQTDRARPAKPDGRAPVTRAVRDLAYVEVASTELAREINRDIILELIRAHQPIARVDLVRHSGLQNSTVSSIVEQLIEEGWICEGEAVKTARGRRPTQISLNSRLAMLVADVRPGRAAIGVVDLNGELLSRSDVALPHDPAKGTDALADALLRLQKQFPEHTFEGAGICLPGRIDPASHQLILAPNLRWEDFAVGETLAARLGMSVEIENDANACLLSELWFGHLDGVRNAVLLAISEGVGASLLADGQLICGHQGMAGEFGHICYDPSGPTCGCGRRGCWEVFASSTAALRAYTKLTGKKETLRYEELCHRAEKGDKAALEALQQQATAIGRGLRMVTAALSPEVVSFAGEITLAWPTVEPILTAECSQTLLAGDPPRLLSAGDGEVAHLLGGAAVVLQRHSGYYRSRNPKKERPPATPAAKQARSQPRSHPSRPALAEAAR